MPLDEHQRVRRPQVYRNAPSVLDYRPQPLCSRLEYAMLLHTKVPIAQDHVVEHLYAYYLRCPCEPPRYLAVLVARLDPPARVVVRENDAGRARPYGRLEDLPWMYQGSRERADRDRRELYYFVLGV